MGSGDDSSIQVQNPGDISLEASNAPLAAENQRLSDLRNRFNKQNEAAALNRPDFEARLARRSQEAQAAASTSTLNRFANLGIAGSSAAFGAAAGAERRVGQAFQDRRLAEEQAFSQRQANFFNIDQGLSGQIRQNILTGQQGFSNLQNQRLSAEQAAFDRSNDLTGQIIGGVATVGGSLLGGPLGGAAANRAADQLTGRPSPPQAFQPFPGVQRPPSKFFQFE